MTQWARLLLLTGTLLGVALLSPPARAQETRAVAGTVVDSSGRPIPYVYVDAGAGARTITDRSGFFALRLSSTARLSLVIKRIGFLPLETKLDPGNDTTLPVTMNPLAVLLTTQVVRAREQVRKLELSGFYERMQDATRGSLVGEFITPEEIEMRNPQRPTQLLEQRRGIQVRRFGSCQVITTCYRITGSGMCAATVYLDGHRLNRLEDPSASIQSAPAIDELITVTSISVIEVYPRGSSAPLGTSRWLVRVPWW